LPFVEIGKTGIEYSVVKGTSRTYTYFRFRPDLTLEVILPRGKRVNIEEELREKASWIHIEYDRLSKLRRVLTQNSVMFNGNPLKIIYSDDPADRLVPNIAGGKVNAHSTDRKRIKELVRRWFLKESSAYVVRKAGELAPTIGVRPKRVDIREIGKWGYCTRDGRLSFSWQLIALPERLQEYVVIHEMVHLVEFNHSRAFKAKMAALCPDFRERERELDRFVPYDKLAAPE
jgi:predicted metal-dependent hydrolase